MPNGPIAAMRRRFGAAVQWRVDLAVVQALAAQRDDVSAVIGRHEKIAAERHAEALAAAAAQEREIGRALELLRGAHRQDRIDDAAAHETQLDLMRARLAGIDDRLAEFSDYISEIDDEFTAHESKSVELTASIARLCDHGDAAIEQLSDQLDAAVGRLARLLNSVSITLTDEQRVQGALLERLAAAVHGAQPASQQLTEDIAAVKHVEVARGERDQG